MSSLAASSSQSSNRIALAPIRDSRLNINSPLNLKNKRSYTSSLVDVVGPSTPSDSVKRQKVMPTQTQTLKASKSVSFSDFRLGATPSKTYGLHGKPLVARSTNVTAGLAATKLKLKLQLAFYKLQHKSTSINNKPGNEYIDATKSHTQTNTSFDSSDIFTKPTSISPVDKESHLPTPPKLTGYLSSANINLQTKTRIVLNPSNHAKRTACKFTKKPSLSAIAYDKNVSNFKNTQNLRLFSVKKGSQYYHDVSKVPLVPRDAAASDETKAVRADSEIIPRSTVTSDGSMIRLPKPLMCKVNMESSNLRSQSNPVSLKSMSLPPINKILKTPMKNSSSTRTLVNSYLQNQNQPLTLTHAKQEDANQTILNTDETIDEDEDGPLRESTCNSIKVSKKDNNNILSSSPIRNSQNTFGTPNSFSVAKSLLQLGSGFYG